MKLSSNKLSLTKLGLGYLAILTSTLLLQACGGGGLAGGDNKDIDTMRPVAGTEDISARPRPPENAVVITTDEHLIYDALKQPIFLRGINHHYAANATTRIAGIPAIKLTGSNAIRLQLDESTTEIQFEAAMAKIAEAGMVAVVTLTAPSNKLTCTEDSAYLLEAVDTLWFKKFLPILVQDRFQSHLMLNIANGWGAMDIFNQDSLGYQEYIDTYKSLIRKFRTAGFKFPLVIDAPSCGQDFNAFLNGRSRELMAADSAKNLVFGVHVEGPKWNSSDEIINAATQLYNEKVPFIVTDLIGSGVAAEGDAPVDHNDLIEKSAGNVALAFNLPWSTATDSAAYAANLEAPLDLRGGAVVSTYVFLDKLYAEFERNSAGNYVQKGKLSFALYIKDDKGNTLKAGSAVASDLRSNQWSKLAFTLPKSVGEIDPANLMNGATSFDLTKVATLGIQIMANGKPAVLKALIKFDDLSILPGVPPMLVQGFEDGLEGWSVDNATISASNGSLSIVPTGGSLQMNLDSNRSRINFSKTLNVTMRVFVPTEYAADLSGWYIQAFAQFGPGWSWNAIHIASSAITPGQWSDVKFTLPFNSSVSASDIGTVQSFGLQLGNVNLPKANPILIDSISISDANAKPTKTVIASQYKATFIKGTEGFVNAGWDGGKAVTSMAGGELLVTVPAGDGGAINKADINSVAEIDFKGGITVNMKVFIPADWAGTDFWIKFFMQDGNWNHFEYSPALDVSKFTPGEWTSLEFKVDEFPANFSRVLKPQMFGMQYGKVPAGTIKLDDIEIFGATQVDDSKPIFTLGFETEEQYNAVKFDFAAGGFTESGLATAKFAEWKVIPFGWLASSWKGNTGDNAVLDISKAEDIVDLTERGEEIVNGVLGIKATSMPANFYQAPKVN